MPTQPDLPQDAAGDLSLRARLLPYLLIVAAAALLMLPAFLHGIPNGDDAAMHYRRHADFIEAMREGVWYPRWLPRSNFHQGTPVMLYYPPLPYYVTAAINVIVNAPFVALTLGCWLGLLLSGLTMYVFSRQLLPRWAALLAAVFYMAVPYHLFDFYHRAALSEFWAFAWLPAMLDAARRVAEGRGVRAALYLAASFAGLLLTHVTISFEMAMLLPVYLLLLTRRVRRLLQAAGGLALGAMMSAIFLCPLLLEVRYIRIDRALRISFEDYFLFRHLGSAFNRHIFPPPEGRRFFYLDGVNVIAVSLAVLLLVCAIVIWRERRRAREFPLIKSVLPAVWAFTALSLLLTTRLTAPLWRVARQFPYIQFPFRWLTVTAAGAALLSGCAMLVALRAERLRFVYAGLLAAALLFTLTVSTLLVSRATYNRQELEDGLNGLEVAEYRTIYLDRQKRLDEFVKPAIVVQSGDAQASAVDDMGARQSYTIAAATSATLVVRPQFFPGWKAWLDGNPAAIEPSREGNIQLAVEPGEHTLTLRFEDTWPRTLGKILSALAALLFLVLLWLTRRRDDLAGR
ncbi:MAG TPA: 6-pyruvoyl-tetrahydropterin synthase-related protein [Blastocatellia bacterium]|nr:6-pyruvoyl-tetrahydropterin synthase-related protein [Blastocatellia bacterium]